MKKTIIALAALALTTLLIAVPAPAQVRASVVTPAQYGAVCNGTHDDTSAMQSAINAAAKAGGPLQLPKNATCLITATLTLPSNITVEGQGGSVLQWSTGGPFLSSARSAETNITLTYLSITGSGSGLPSGLGHNNEPGIRINDASHVTFNGIHVSYDTGVAISLLSVQNVLVENSRVDHSGRDGITAFETGDQQVKNYTITNNVIDDVGDDAIAVDVSQCGCTPPPLAIGVTITDNIMNGWGSNGTKPNPNGKQLGRGIAMNGVAQATVTGNVIDWTYSAGLMISGCTTGWCGSSYAQHPDTDVTAQQNTIQNAGQDFPFSTNGQGGQPTYGIYIFNSKAPVVVTNNPITNPLSGGVKIGNPGCNGGCSIQPK